MVRRAKPKNSEPPSAFGPAQTFMENLPARAWIKDGNGKYVYVNRRLLEDFGATEADWLGTTDEQHSPLLAQAYRKNDELVLSTRKPLRSTEIVQRGDHQEFALSLKFPVRDGDEILVAGIAIETTEEIRALEGLHHINQAMFRNERLRSIGEFAAGVAHDLNNALNAVMFRLARVRASQPQEISTHIDALERLVNNAAERVRSISDFARTQQNVELQPINVREQLRSAVEMVDFLVFKSVTLLGARTRLELRLPEDLPLALAPPAEITHVFANLLLNAHDAMPNGGTITVEGSSRAGMVSVSIADEGGGIPEQHLPKIFEAFFTTKLNGSGLGLSMAHDIMSRLGGSIEAANRPEGGAVFTMTFPIYSRELKRA